jgi:hypothetical protein
MTKDPNTLTDQELSMKKSGHIIPYNEMKGVKAMEDKELVNEIENLKSEIKAHVFTHQSMTEQWRRCEESIKNHMKAIEFHRSPDKYEAELEKCTQLLDKHWPESMSCNGYLQVAGHLENILHRQPDTALVEALEGLYYEARSYIRPNTRDAIKELLAKYKGKD